MKSSVFRRSVVMIHGKINVKSNKDQTEKEVEQKIQKVLENIGLTAETYTKLLCPVDTGNLRNSITHQVHDKTVYIGTNVEYGKYVEAGTYKMVAQPYLRPAIEGHFKEYKLIAQNGLKD